MFSIVVCDFSFVFLVFNLFFGFSCFKIAYWSNFWTILTALKLICLLWLTITLLKLCLKSKPMKSWALWVWLVGISDVSVGKVVCICSSVCVLVCVLCVLFACVCDRVACCGGSGDRVLCLWEKCADYMLIYVSV